MDFYGNRYTDISENIGDTQDVTRDSKNRGELYSIFGVYKSG